MGNPNPMTECESKIKVAHYLPVYLVDSPDFLQVMALDDD